MYKFIQELIIKRIENARLQANFSKRFIENWPLLVILGEN